MVRGEGVACKFANFGFSKKWYVNYNYIPNFMPDAFILSKKTYREKKNPCIKLNDKGEKKSAKICVVCTV